MRRGRPPYPDVLTPREQEVLALIREGLTNEQIGVRLGISDHGAKYHVAEILSKLGVSSRQEAARWPPVQPVAPSLALLLIRRTLSVLTAVAVGLIALAAGVFLMDGRAERDPVVAQSSTPEANATPIAYQIAEAAACPMELVWKNETPEDWGGEYYVRYPDGRSVNITKSTPSSEHFAAFSPDCSRIVFGSNRYGPFVVFTVDPDGRDLRQVSFPPKGGCCGGDQEPKWSPDGKYISFESSHRDGVQKVYVMRPDGSGLYEVAEGFKAQWTTDGRIEYTGISHFGEPPVYLINPDGTGQLVVYAGTRPEDEHLEEVTSPEWQAQCLHLDARQQSRTLCFESGWLGRAKPF